MSHERLQLFMTMPEAVAEMSDGNPGAVTVMALLLRDGGAIDRDDAFGGFGSLMSLDTLGIYGPRIWGLFKDVCAGKLHAFIAVLRAWQLGQLEGCTREAIVQAIEARNNLGGGGTVLDIDRIVAAVAERLPGFVLPAPPPPETNENEENSDAEKEQAAGNV